MRYCMRCGQELIKREEGRTVRYDTETGKPVYSNVFACSSWNYTRAILEEGFALRVSHSYEWRESERA